MELLVADLVGRYAGLARMTRHHGTLAPYSRMIAPTCRGPPWPTYSAMSPYVATLPSGIDSTASSTASTYSSLSTGLTSTADE